MDGPGLLMGWQRKRSRPFREHNSVAGAIVVDEL